MFPLWAGGCLDGFTMGVASPHDPRCCRADVADLPKHDGGQGENLELVTQNGLFIPALEKKICLGGHLEIAPSLAI
jgi:hypothetical protein